MSFDLNKNTEPYIFTDILKSRARGCKDEIKKRIILEKIE